MQVKSAKRMNLRKDFGPGSPADTRSGAIQNLKEKTEQLQMEKNHVKSNVWFHQFKVTLDG
jgi:hypothetical protein